jgi:uncharacterized lipoprotein
MSGADRDAAWALEAKGVAKDIGLSDADTGKVVAAYKASRDRHASAMQEMMSTGERGPGMFQQMRGIADTERGKLAEELESAIGKENADKAVKVLGTYNRQWDRLVGVLSGFGLEADKEYQGLSLIAKYVVDASAAQEEAFATMDIEGMRSAMQELKATLDSAMGDVLSAEQLATWKEQTAGRGGFGGGGRRGPGGRGPN